MKSVVAGRLPPGPKARAVIGDLFKFRRDTNGYLLELARRYGDVAGFRLGRRDAFLLSRPDLVRDVLVTRADDFLKGRMMQRAKRVLGEGLLTSEGEFHRTQRQKIQPGFRREQIAAYGALMVGVASRTSERWEEGAMLDVADEMMRVNMAIVARALFDADVDSEADELGRALRVIGTWFPLLTLPFARVLDKLPIPLVRHVKQAQDRLEITVARIIAERQTTPRGDLVSRLLASRDAGGRAMDPTQVRDEVMTLFLAGHETTATALTWMWYLLSKNPAVEARLHAELDAVLGGRAPAAEDVDRLVYAERVFSEALRLYPPVGRMGRRPLKDYRVDRYTIPAGSVVFVSPYVMHRSPRYFPNPDSFDPERWTPEGRAARPRFAYFPFGAGPRHCVGEPFARAAALLVLATIAQQWRLRLVAGHPVEVQTLITLRPKHGMRMTLERRGTARRRPTG